MQDADPIQIETEMTRALRQQDIQPEITRPVAAPVDTFANPHAGEQLAQLANALGQVSPEVAKYGDVMAKNDQENDKAAAEMNVSDALRNGAKTYADAVQSGAIPASASPWYRLYAKNQMGRAMAANMGSDFEAAAQKDLAGGTDLQSFDQYAQNFQKQWLQQNAGSASEDVALRQGFDPEANRVIANVRGSFAEQAGKNLQNQTVDAYTQNVAQTIRLGKQGKLTDQQIADQINLSADAALVHGVSGTQINQANAQAITNAATDSLDSSILGLGGLVKAGTGTLQDTEVFSKLHNETAPYIVRQQVEADNVAHETQVRNEEAVRATTMTSALQALQDDPQTDIRPYLAKLYATNDYAAIESLTAHQSALSRRDAKDDADQYSQSMAAAENPNGPTISMGHISSLIGNHELTPEHGHELIDILNQRQKDAEEKDKQNSFRKDPNYIIQVKALSSDFTTSVGGKGILGAGYGNAQSSLNAQLQELITSPSYIAAKPADRSKMADDIRQAITHAFAPPQAETPPDPQFGKTQASIDYTFARQLRKEGAAGTLSPATIQGLHDRKLFTSMSQKLFMQKMGVLPPTPTTP